MEDELPEEGAEIMLVLESTLFMVPWAMLKGSCNPEIFSERYVLIHFYIVVDRILNRNLDWLASKKISNLVNPTKNISMFWLIFIVQRSDAVKKCHVDT